MRMNANRGCATMPPWGCIFTHAPFARKWVFCFICQSTEPGPRIRATSGTEAGTTLVQKSGSKVVPQKLDPLKWGAKSGPHFLLVKSTGGSTWLCRPGEAIGAGSPIWPAGGLPFGGLLATIFTPAGRPNFGTNSGPKIGPDLVPGFEQKVAPAGRPGCIKFPGTWCHFGGGVTLSHFFVRFSLALRPHWRPP